MRISLKQRIISGMTALSVLSSVLFPSAAVFAEAIPTDDAAVTIVETIPDTESNTSAYETEAPVSATETTAPSSETDSTSDTEDTSVSETAQTISETEAASESETTSENTETYSDETLADTSDAEAGTAASADFAYKSADIDISLVIDRGRYIIDDTEIPRNEVAFSVCGINTDDASAGTDDKIVRAYSMAFTCGTDRVEAVSDNVLVKYVFTEEVPESAAASIEVYTMSNGAKTRVETLGTSIEDGYVKGLTFKASLPAFDSFCVVWEDTAPKPDESIISADRSYEYSDDTMTARATAFAGAVCTGNADDTAVPENANNISFAVDTADEDDEVCSLFDSNEAENRTVFVQRFYSESYESVDVSDYETAVTYALSVPVPESYGFAVKVRAADEDGISDIEYMPICEDGSITALTFYVKGAFAVYEPVRGEQFSIDYSDDYITASAVIGENAVITAGERAATSDSLYISANILDEDEAASLPVYEETEKKLIYIRAAVMSGEDKADISDSRVSVIYNVGSEEKLSCASAVLMRLDGDQWTQMDIASSSAADDVLQSLSFDASGAEYFVIAADIIPEPLVPHFYEYSDENLSVNVEVDAEAVFSAGGEAEEDEDSEAEEIDAAEVRLYAKEIDAAEDIDIEVGEDERVKFFDIGFETKDGTAVSADLLTSQIDFTIKGEEGESISNIEVFALSDSQTEQIDAAGTEDAADDEDTAQSDASVGVVSVEDNKLTVYAVKYTVDFHYGDYEYNLEGGGDMLLSELFDVLGIEESTKGSTIEFTNDALLRYEMVEDADDPDTAADWRLISLRPFTTVEKLTVRLADGGNVEITVTDDISRYLAVGSSYYFRDVLDWIGIEGSHDDMIREMVMPGFDGVAASKYEVVPVYDHSTLRDYLITIKEPLDTSASLTVGDSPLYVKEVSPGVFEEATAADGVEVKYEFVHPKSSVSDESIFFRLTRGTNTEVGGVQTWHADTAAEDHYFEYELYYVVSGDDKIGVGEMNIVLPLHILRDSQGNYADDIELSIPDKELYDSQQHSSLATDKIYFTYTIDEANNVVRITNVKELSSGDNPTIVYAYKTTKKTYDYNDGVPSEPAFANIRIDTTSASDSTKPVIVSGHTEQIPVAIDTDVKIKNTEKTIAQSSISQLWKEEWNNSLSLGSNDYHIDQSTGEIVYDYVYMVWKVNSSFVSYDIDGNEIHAGNNSITKRYSFSLTDDQISAINEKGVAINGEIIGVNLAGRNEWVAWDGKTDTTEIDRLVGKDRTDYVLVRYPKSAVNLYDEDAATGKKTPVKVTFNNDVKNQIIPQGDTEISDHAHGEISYTPPTYKPPEENTEFDKHGKYGGNIDVKSDKDISFYNLETLVNKHQPIKGLKYNTKMFSSMLPLTFDPDESLSQTEEDVEHYQWADAVYILKDETLSLTDLNQSKNNADYKAYELKDDDYCFSHIDYELQIVKGKFDVNDKTFKNSGFDAADEPEIEVRVRLRGSSDYVTVGAYNARTKVMTPAADAEDIVSDISETGVVFKNDDVVGFEFYSKNKFFITSVDASPYVTLNPTPGVIGAIGSDIATPEEYKIRIDNTAELTIKKHDDTTAYSGTAIGKTYVSKENRFSSIKKIVNIPSDENEVMNHLYKVPWKVEMYEKVKEGANADSYPYVYQQSGRFYDLLPVTSTARIEGVRVYAGNADGSYVQLEEGEYTYSVDEHRYDASRKMDRVLLTVDIDRGAYFYWLEVTTVHTYEDILDYGRYLMNSAAYETGNEDIAGGYPDNGGTISEKSLMHDLDPDTDDRKFIYAQNNWNVQALISNLIGFRKQVSSKRDIIPSSRAIVGPDEIYTYSFRLKNGNTNQKNIVFMDAIEDLNGTDNYNEAYGFVREWRGEPVGFRLGNLPSLGIKPVLYVTTNEMDLRKYAPHDSGYATDDKFASEFVSNVVADTDAGWVKLECTVDGTGKTTWYTAEGQEYDLSNMKAFVIDLSKKDDNTDFVLAPNGTVSFSLDMRSPASGMVDTDKDGDGVYDDIYTYNNAYTCYAESATGNTDAYESAFMHYEHTTVTYRVIGDVRLKKTNSSTDAAIPGVQFKLTGTSDYGENIELYMTTNAHGEIVFSGIEKGTYTLTEEHQTDDYLPITSMTVVVDENGTAHIQTANNEVLAFDINLNMVDSNGTVTMGVTYDLYDDGGNLIATETQPYSDQGTYIFKDIPVGEYRLDETKGANVTSYGISVDNNSVVWDYNNTDTIKTDNEGIRRFYRLTRKLYDVENTPRVHGDLRFFKRDSKTDKTVSGSVFTLTTIGNGDNDKTKYGYEYTKTAEGTGGTVLFENIEMGRYVLTETTYPDGYVPVTTVRYIAVTAGAGNKAIIRMYSDSDYSVEVTDKSGDVYVIKNEPFYNFRIRKVDSVNTTEKLSGAVFTLVINNVSSIETSQLDPSVWTNVGGTYVQTITTDANGLAQFKDLKGGCTYVLTETAAPANHRSISSEYIVQYNVTVDPNGVPAFTKLYNAADVVIEPDEGGTIYDITNDRTYDDEVTVVKKWIGDPNMSGSDPVFPELILSTEEQQYGHNYVTIDKTLLHSLPNVKNCTAIDYQVKQIDSTDGYISIKLNDGDETGLIYAKVEGTTLHIMTNAERVYLPPDSYSSEFFKGFKLSNAAMNELLDKLNTTKVTDMSSMFENCTGITNPDLSKFDTSGVTNMSSMFKGCTGLTSLDVSSFDTSNVEYMNSMFEGCTQVVNINIDPRLFKADSAIKNVSAMFKDCERVEKLDLRGFGLCPSLADASSWFESCRYLKFIDLSNFVPTQTLSNIDHCFQWCGYGNAKGYHSNTQPWGVDSDYGCAVFASGTWNTSAVRNPNSSAVNPRYDNFWRINLYGNICKDAKDNAGDPVHLKILEQADAIPSQICHTGSNYPKLKNDIGYFNSANSSYYRDTFPKLFGKNYLDLLTTPLPTTPVNPNPDPGSTTLNPSVTYKTAASGTLNQDGTYTVDETVEVVGSDGQSTTKHLRAVWTLTSTDEWVCTLQVYNPKDEYFVVEQDIAGYDSDAFFSKAADPLTPKLKMTDGTVTIRNKQDEVVLPDYGSLSIEKELSPGYKAHADEFTFEVVITQAGTAVINGDTHFGAYSFTASGAGTTPGTYSTLTGTVTVHAGDKVILEDIPAGFGYTVTETSIPNGYAQGTVTNEIGTITKDITTEYTCTNDVNLRDLTVTKAVEHYLETEAPENKIELTDAEKAQRFEMTAEFDHLLVDTDYTFVITRADGTTEKVPQNSGAEGECIFTFELAHGDSAKLDDIPQNADYQIIETDTDFTESMSIDGAYTVGNDTGTQAIGESDVTVDVKNVIVTERPPKLVNVSVEKKWTKEEGGVEKEITQLSPPISYANADPVTVSLMREYTDSSTHQSTLQTSVLDQSNTFRETWTDLRYQSDDNVVYSYYVTEQNAGTDVETYYRTDAALASDNTKMVVCEYRNGANVLTIDGVTYTYSESGTAVLNIYNKTTGTTEATTVSGRTVKLGDVVKYVEYPRGSHCYAAAGGDGTPEFSLYSSQFSTENATEYAIFVCDADGNMDMTVTNRIMNSYTVSIKKEVNGNLGNKAKKYRFTVTLTDKDGAPWKPAGLKVDIDGAVTEYPFTLGIQDIYLTHGQTAKILGLPENTVNVSVKEIMEDGYTVKSSLAFSTDAKFDPNDPFKDDSSQLADTMTQATGRLLDEDAYVYYLNSYSGIIPTGANVPKVSVIFMGFLAAGVIYLAKREKIRVAGDDEEE